MGYKKQDFLIEIKKNDDCLFIVLKALVDVTQLSGWILRALWEDCKFALGHRKSLLKIVIYGVKGRYQ
jgi:hypothetical protein